MGRIVSFFRSRWSDKAAELIKNTSIFGFGLFGAKVVQVLLLPYFTNVFSRKQYGTIDLVVTFVDLIVPIVTLELSSAILRFGLSEGVDRKVLSKNAMVILSAGIFVIFLCVPLLQFYKTLSPYKYYVAMLLILHCVRAECSIYVKSVERITVYAIDNILVAFITAVTDIILITGLGYGINGYFTAEIIGYIFSILYLIIVGKLYQFIDIRVPVDKTLLIEMLRYSAPLVLNGVSWWITSFSDRIVLNYFFSEDEVGIYSISAKFPSLLSAILSVFTQAWIISAIKEYERNKESRFFDKICIYYSLILTLMVCVGTIFIESILKIFISEEFFDAWRYVPYLLLGSAFLAISNFFGSIFAAAKKNILEIKSTVICAMCNIILNLILIPNNSIQGAVIATMISYLILFVIRIYDASKLIKIRKHTFIQLFISTLFSIAVAITTVHNQKIISLIIFFVWCCMTAPVIKHIKKRIE